MVCMYGHPQYDSSIWCLQETHVLLLLLKCMRFWLLNKVNLKLNTSKSPSQKANNGTSALPQRSLFSSFMFPHLNVGSHVFSDILIPTGSLYKPGWFVLFAQRWKNIKSLFGSLVLVVQPLDFLFVFVSLQTPQLCK